MNIDIILSPIIESVLDLRRKLYSYPYNETIHSLMRIYFYSTYIANETAHSTIHPPHFRYPLPTAQAAAEP